MPRSFAVTAPDGIKLAAYEWGSPRGRPIIFIHGFSQCHLSWTKQIGDDAIGRDFRCIAYDLRGHGASDKPSEKDRYTHDRLWADDLAAVMTAAGVNRPVLVAWSYAGRVVADFVRAHGTKLIAGVNFVAAVTKSEKNFMGPGAEFIGQMTSDDLAENIAGTAAFVRACFERQPSPAEFETMLAFNMVVPARVRALVLERTPNRGDTLARLDVPTLVTHGAKDRIVLPQAGRTTAATVPGATLSIYEAIGHAPFFEDAPRFNRELAEFAHRAASRG